MHRNIISFHYGTMTKREISCDGKTSFGTYGHLGKIQVSGEQRLLSFIAKALNNCKARTNPEQTLTIASLCMVPAIQHRCLTRQHIPSSDHMLICVTLLAKSVQKEQHRDGIRKQLYNGSINQKSREHFKTAEVGWWGSYIPTPAPCYRQHVFISQTLSDF